MKKIILGLFISFSLAAVQSKAQDTLTVAAGGQIFNLPATHYYGDTGSYYVYFKNISSSNFNGTVSFYTVVDTSAGPTIFQTDSATFFLSPGDSVPVVIQEVYDTTYRVGGNIVVIWPQSTPSVYFTNTSESNMVYILGFMSVGETSTRGFHIYPVPFKNRLHIVLQQGEIIPEKILLRDISGRLVLELPFAGTAEIPESIADGTYFLELIYMSSAPRIFRLMKTQ